MFKLNRYLHLSILSLILLSSGACADIYVIVSAGSEVQNLSKKQCIDIFMGRARKFDNGKKIEAFDQPKGSALREEFYTKLTGKSLAFINAYWARLFYTGRVQPPSDHLKSSEQIALEVARNPRAIAYVAEAQLSDQVQVVFTLNGNQ
ncbi:phosphate ABC transporter substrate-binding protein [Agaribacterium haliotis]|uniref:phosphate ABC transporter substrate-binding protein n=1 Tax=Agaribacterium haliotis TaxID=2013869 RepID=UPI000BB54622|nr:phosphate ABC transporter substrate-binding protein [Agaribacterium haliotis]